MSKQRKLTENKIKQTNREMRDERPKKAEEKQKKKEERRENLSNPDTVILLSSLQRVWLYFISRFLGHR